MSNAKHPTHTHIDAFGKQRKKGLVTITRRLLSVAQRKGGSHQEGVEPQPGGTLAVFQ